MSGKRYIEHIRLLKIITEINIPLQHRIHTVETVEDFWSLADHIKPPSELMAGVDYSFFKNGIRPMWEDPQNVKGNVCS